MTELTFTDFEPRHTDELVRLWRASFEHGMGMTDPHPIEDQRDFFLREVLPKFKVRIALQDGVLAAFIAADRESVNQLFVGVPHLGQGIGRQLLDWAKRQSGGSLWLYTFARNQRAQHFYEGAGFVVVARGHEPFWQLDDIRYAWHDPAAATIVTRPAATPFMPETLPSIGDAPAEPLVVASPTPHDDAAPPAPVPELSPAACAARLAELFPALFAQRPQPLKLRIQADIQQRAPGIFTRRSLSAFLHRHTTTTAYLLGLSQAPQRVDLDGNPAGEISDEHRQAAVAELARRRALHEERRAAENAARRAADAQARQAHAAQDQARRDRAALLRAFETSTLTRANFCALKGLAEADLEAQLTQARVEATQRAQEPRQETRHEPRRDARHEPRGEPRRDPAAPGGPRRDGGRPASRPAPVRRDR